MHDHLLRAWVELLTTRVRAADPNHIISMPRLAIGTSVSGLPVIISEFGIRAKIDGWSNKGGAGSFVPSADATDDQIQRGAYYQSQPEQFYRFKGIIGAN